jgi:hypothetical protein
VYRRTGPSQPVARVIKKMVKATTAMTMGGGVQELDYAPDQEGPFLPPQSGGAMAMRVAGQVKAKATKRAMLSFERKLRLVL